MKYLILSICLLASIQVFAQKNSDIKGFLVDSTEQPLIGASAILYFQKDSLLTGFSLTDDTGRFQFNNVAPGEYYLQLSYVGYNSQNKSLDKGDFSGEINLGNVALESNTDLEAVIVTNAPLEVRKDTIIYDADAFQTKPNATVEDLLKKLPGIEVEDDGSITAQGEEVQNVLVDGKKFFGDDPKIATQNLPADAIKNVEVYDKKSEKAEFTGVDDGEEEKTINLELKEDRKNGYFGNVKAGGGLDPNNDNGLYTGKALISRFSPGNQISAIASSNNVNDEAFTFRDYFSMSGQTFGGRGRRSVAINSNDLLNQDLNSGINRSSVAGANWNTTFGEKVDFHTDYFYNQINNNYKRAIDREYFQSAGDFDYNEISSGEDISKNHRLNFDITTKFNKRNELKFENQFSYADKDNIGGENSSSVNSLGQNINTNNTLSAVTGQNFALNSDLFWKHRFVKEGRSVFVNFGFNNTNTDETELTQAQTILSETNQTTILDQDLTSDYNVNTWKGDISYTEPLFDKQYLELNYIVTNETEDRDQDFYDLSTNSPVLIDSLTNQFDRDYLVHRPGLTYKIIGDKHDFDFGLKYESAQLDGVTSLSTDAINQSFNQVLPFFTWRYDISQGRRIRFNYISSQNAPSVNQLQPAVNNTNPLNIYTGNPDLEAEVYHNVFANFFSFDRFSFTNLFATLRYTYTSNKIVNAQSFDENLVQTTTPVNVDHQSTASANLNYGKPIRAIRMRFNSRINTNFTDGILFLNGVQNDYTRWTNSFRLNLDNTNDEKFEYGAGFEISKNNTKYSENEENNQDYVNQFYNAEFFYSGVENWIIGSEFDYGIYGQATRNATRQELPIWEASISRSFADNLGEVELSVYDILNRNTGISQQQNLNYAQEEVYNALGRYGMMTLTWKIIDKAGKEDREAAKSGDVPMPAPPPADKGDGPKGPPPGERPPPPPQ